MSEPTPLRVLVDTNIVDALMKDEILRNGLRDLTDIGAAEVLINHVVVDEIMAVPDMERRNRLVQTMLWVGAKTVQTPAFILDRSRLGLAKLGDDRSKSRFDEYLEGRTREGGDALIAMTAAAEQVPLATADKRQGRARRHVPELAVLSPDEFRTLVNERLVAEGRRAPSQLDAVRGIQSGELGIGE